MALCHLEGVWGPKSSLSPFLSTAGEKISAYSLNLHKDPIVYCPNWDIFEWKGMLLILTPGEQA